MKQCDWALRALLSISKYTTFMKIGLGGHVNPS
jgi:hypothetical protein